MHCGFCRCQALAFVRAKEVKTTARCIKAQECDATKVNASKRRHFKVGAPVALQLLCER